MNWNAQAALAPLGSRATVMDDLAQLTEAVVAMAQPEDHIVIMSNGSFGGIHDTIITALHQRLSP